MTKQEFEKLCQQGLLYLDGATGSNLQAAGMSAGICSEQWILEHKEVFFRLQKGFLKAGSQILYAPTFGANRIQLAKYHLQEDIKNINQELVELSKEVAGKNAYVAGDLTMTGEQIEPWGEFEFEDLIEVYKEQILYLEQSGVDLLVIETLMTLQEARAALIAAKECSDLPVMVTLTFHEDGNTLYGTSPEAAVVTLQELGASAVGANCSVGPDKMITIIQRMKKYAKVPIIAKPNAGEPKILENGEIIYSMSSHAFAQSMKKLVQAGATVIGGCCGTTILHIEEMIKATGECFVEEKQKEKKEYVSSSRIICPGSDEYLNIIEFQKDSKCYQDLEKRDYELALDNLERYKNLKNQILKISIPSDTEKEKRILKEFLEQVMIYYDMPLCFQIDDEKLLEETLRKYSGRAFVELKDKKERKSLKLQEISKKYGAIFQ